MKSVTLIAKNEFQLEREIQVLVVAVLMVQILPLVHTIIHKDFANNCYVCTNLRMYEIGCSSRLK